MTTTLAGSNQATKSNQWTSHSFQPTIQPSNITNVGLEDEEENRVRQTDGRNSLPTYKYIYIKTTEVWIHVCRKVCERTLNWTSLFRLQGPSVRQPSVFWFVCGGLVVIIKCCSTAAAATAYVLPNLCCLRSLTISWETHIILFTSSPSFGDGSCFESTATNIANSIRQILLVILFNSCCLFETRQQFRFSSE